MHSRAIRRFVGVTLLSITLGACSWLGQSNESDPVLRTGMTTQQAIAKLGQPDLTDSVASKNHEGFTLLRYVWLDSGKAALFGPDNHLVKVEKLQSGKDSSGGGSATATTTSTAETVQMEAPPPSLEEGFDPINTPLNYLFYPVKALFYFFGAGLNCAANAGCQMPEMPGPQGG